MSYLSDVIPYWPDWILASAMLIIHFSLTFGWQFDPNCPRGYIGPGGLYDNVTHVHCVGGAANKLDRLIFTRKHLYGAFTGRELYDPQEKMDLAHDPEGLLGVTTSIVLTFFGLQVGKVLLTYSSTKQRLVRWYLWAAVLGKSDAGTFRWTLSDFVFSLRQPSSRASWRAPAPFRSTRTCGRSRS